MAKRVPWDLLQDAELAELTIAGVPQDEIAKKMGRTPMAISVRKAKLGIRHEAPMYVVHPPEGQPIAASSISEFVRSNWAAMDEGEMPESDLRRTKPAMGLEWALKTGRKWKGWSVKLQAASSKPGSRKLK